MSSTASIPKPNTFLLNQNRLPYFLHPSNCPLINPAPTQPYPSVIQQYRRYQQDSIQNCSQEGNKKQSGRWSFCPWPASVIIVSGNLLTYIHLLKCDLNKALNVSAPVCLSAPVCSTLIKIFGISGVVPSTPGATVVGIQENHMR